MKTIVMKFGGRAVEKTERFPLLADLILERKKEFQKIVIVVSAMGNMTEELFKLAGQVSANPPKREVDMLISVGERISISLLAMALFAKGQEAVSFTGSQSGIITTDDHSDAKIVDVRPFRLCSCLEKEKIVIVAGFQGVSDQKEITTLGRGGSDTTAVALAAALNAEKVEFYKNVPGIYKENPRQSNKNTLFTTLSYAQALDVVTKTGGEVLAPRAILLAAKNRIPLVVRSFDDRLLQSPGTKIFENFSKPSGPRYEKG